MSQQFLEMFTIYERPLDYPNEYVCRRQVVGPNFVQTDSELTVRAPTLEACRQLLHRKRFGLTRISRSQDDEPQIVEVWL